MTSRSAESAFQRTAIFTRQAARLHTCSLLRPASFGRADISLYPPVVEEGAGSGVGEQRFLSAMRDTPDVQSILDDARKNGYPPGQQRAFVMAKVLEKSKVIIVGSGCPDIVAACKMIPAATMDEAIRIAAKDTGRVL